MLDLILLINKYFSKSKSKDIVSLYCTSGNNQGTFATGKIRQNTKIAAFWCVFFTKKKVDPESW